jgi:ribosomal-protein-alanine N-acetyltransferase
VPLTVRPARPEDTPAIARVHVESWRSTYRGLIAADHLAKLSLEDREKMWTRTLADPRHGKTSFVLVAEDPPGSIVGFAAGGPERTGDPRHAGELYAIYVLESAQRSGAGRSLTAELARRLVKAGIPSLLVWVLERNPSRRFYERLGGTEVGRKVARIGDEDHEEIAYGWSDARVLSSPVLRTERLRLRPWRKEDREAFVVMMEDPRMTEFLPRRDRKGYDAWVDRMQAHFLEHGFGFWAVEVAGGAPFVGCVGLLHVGFTAHFTPCIEVGWRLAPDAWGRGYATEAALASLRYGFETLGEGEIVAFTIPANARSIRVMERLGMARRPEDDFDHPNLPPGDRLRRHVLYRLPRGASTRELDSRR